MSALISIVVPVYNTEKYLKQCVDSVLSQTYRNLEVILVDDGSTDGSPAICDEYAMRDSRVRVIHKENGGLSDARNSALDAMTGEYVGFVDSDDWVAPDMFEYLHGGLVGNRSGISVCEPIEVRTYRMDYKVRTSDIVYDSEVALNELFFDRQGNYAWNKLYKSDLWKDIRFPKDLNFEDIATIYKTFESAGRISFLRDPKYYYRIRRGSISGSKDYSFRRDIYRAVIARYEDVAPRLPQYKAPLFRRVRNWYIHELCREFKYHPENEMENQALLETLAPFVEKNKDDIAQILHFEKMERKKLDAFAKGSREGCMESLRCHDLMWKKRNAKAKIKKKLKF
ncbi:glycosyltransferase family 2 protein [Eggerthella lenta]|uniref:glycosyltransferase family 2 protein n=1 Tax=Eggerthella lenta TaxID=84112 RepID=UPI00130540EF|nr:glycosyltransferase [Eggerthella lenta]